MVITGNHNADDQTMLRERLGEVGMFIRSKGLTNNSTLGSRAGLSTGLLNDLIDIDRHSVTAEIFRPL